MCLCVSVSSCVSVSLLLCPRPIKQVWPVCAHFIFIHHHQWHYALCTTYFALGPPRSTFNLHLSPTSLFIAQREAAAHLCIRIRKWHTSSSTEHTAKELSVTHSTYNLVTDQSELKLKLADFNCSTRSDTFHWSSLWCEINTNSYISYKIVYKSLFIFSIRNNWIVSTGSASIKA